jgi:hypothetical protein
MNSNPEHNSFIHDLQIASPCKVDWDSMTGDERKRFCGQCKLNVYNISSMTLPEAEKLVADAEGKVCLRMYRRTDGTVITKDCPVGVAAKIKRNVQRYAGVACAAATVLIGWAVNTRVGNQLTLWEQMSLLWNNSACHTGTPGLHATMGEVAMPVKAEMGKIAMPVKPVVVPEAPGTRGSHGAPRGYIKIANPPGHTSERN